MSAPNNHAAMDARMARQQEIARQKVQLDAELAELGEVEDRHYQPPGGTPTVNNTITSHTYPSPPAPAYGRHLTLPAANPGTQGVARHEPTRNNSMGPGIFDRLAALDQRAATTRQSFPIPEPSHLRRGGNEGRGRGRGRGRGGSKQSRVTRIGNKDNENRVRPLCLCGSSHR